MRLAFAWISLGLLMVCLACVPQVSGRDYGWYDARQPMLVERGVVDTVRHVALEGSQSGAGAAAGATAGAIAGSAVGQGSGSALASVAGAILGGLAGNAIEKGATAQKGLEITVRMEDGRLLAIVQGDDVAFYPGDEVEVLTAPNGKARVRHQER
jgi:outer membrane lipoprotein SlyB